MSLPLKDCQFITDELEIIDIFRGLLGRKEKLWLWQSPENAVEQGPLDERSVHLAIVRKVDLTKKSITLFPVAKSGFNFNSKDPLYLYSREKNIAVKSPPKTARPDFVSLPLPQKISTFTDYFSSFLSIVEKEDEQANLEKRNSPRKKAKGPQSVLLQTLDDEEGTGPTKKVIIYDISSGGLALKVNDPGEFEKGQKLLLFSVNETALPRPIQGIVRSIRYVEEDKYFKVGVQFDVSPVASESEE